MRSVALMVVSVLCLVLVGCKRDDMADQARFKPLAPSSFYADGASARMPVRHTVAVDDPLQEDSVLWRGPLSTATQFPFAITRADLTRGQEVFQIDCSPCHGLLGDGDGMVPERGFTRPPSYHSERLRNAPPTYFYNVITNGIGAMYPYNDRVSSDDRWRVAAYIKALQLSQDAAPGQLTPQEREKAAKGGGP